MSKKLSILYFSLFACLIIHAQDAATSFDVEGIKVIFKPTVKNVISVRMFFRGGVSNYSFSQAGIEDMALKATVVCGTKEYSPGNYKDSCDAYDIKIGSFTTYDYSVVDLNCINAYFDKGWDIFSSTIMHPVFNEAEFAKLKNKRNTTVKLMQSNPASHVEEMQMASAFAGTIYQLPPIGSQNVIDTLSSKSALDYYYSLLNKNRIFIVIAGNITKEKIIRCIKQAFANIPSSPYTSSELREPVWNDYKISSENRPIATNYIRAIMNAPTMSNPDFLPFKFGINAVSGNIFMNVRTKLNLSYDPGARLVLLKMPYAEMFASTTHPAEVMKEMMTQLNTIRNLTVSDDYLERARNSFIVRNYMSQQSSSSITFNLGDAEIYSTWENAEQLPKLVDEVTPQKIHYALNKYILGVHWTYLGNPDPSVKN